MTRAGGASSASKKSSSTPVACLEKRLKLTPAAQTDAPMGKLCPSLPPDTVGEMGAGLRLAICDLSTSPHVDLAGAQMLAGLHDELAAVKIRLQIVEARAHGVLAVTKQDCAPNDPMMPGELLH